METIKRAFMWTSQEGIFGKQSKNQTWTTKTSDFEQLTGRFCAPVIKISLGNNQEDIHGQQPRGQP